MFGLVSQTLSICFNAMIPNIIRYTTEHAMNFVDYIRNLELNHAPRIKVFSFECVKIQSLTIPFLLSTQSQCELDQRLHYFFRNAERQLSSIGLTLDELSTLTTYPSKKNKNHFFFQHRIIWKVR